MSFERNLKNAEVTTWLSDYVTDEEHIANGCIAEIAATIQLQRKAMGYTQKDLAQKLGVSQAIISRWENGVENFTIATLAKISMALGLELRNPFKNLEQLLLVAEANRQEYSNSEEN